MKRTIAMVLALLMVLALVPVIGMNEAQAAGPAVKIKAYPKTSYVYGSAFDPSGLKVEVTVPTDVTYPKSIDYDGSAITTWLGSTEITSATTFDAGAYSSARAYTVTVKYSGEGNADYACETTFKIRIGASAPSASISVLTPPQKEYTLGSKLDLSGMILTLKKQYSAGSAAPVSGYPKPVPATGSDPDTADLWFKLGDKVIKHDDVLSADAFKEGTYTLTVYYYGKIEEDGVDCSVAASTTVTGVRISKSVPTATITIKTPPKTSYVLGQTWNLADLTATVDIKLAGVSVAGYPKDIDYADTTLKYFYDGREIAHDGTIEAPTYAIGTKTLTVLYQNTVADGLESDGATPIVKSVTARTTLDVTINKPTPKAELEILKNPTALYYVPGAALDLTGTQIKVTQYKSNGDFDTGFSETEKKYTYNETSKQFENDADASDVLDTELSYTLGGHPIAADGALDTTKFKAGSNYSLVLNYSGAVVEGTASTAVTASDSAKVYVVKELLKGVALNGSGPDSKVFFLGETLDLTGLAYSLLYSTKPNGAATRTDTSKKLSDFTLRWNNENGSLLTQDSLPKLTGTLLPDLLTPDVATFKIWAGYTDTQQKRTFSDDSVEITVLPSPTALAVEDATNGFSDTDATWVYDKTHLGQTAQLTATVTGAGIDNPNDASLVSWGSLNPAVATVSSTGVLKFLSAGETTIRVSTRGDNQITKSFTVEVGKSNIPLTGVQLNKTDLTLTVGDSDKLITSLIPSGARYDEADVEWKVYDAADGTTEVTDVIEIKVDPDNKLIATVKALAEASAAVSTLTNGEVIVVVTVKDGATETTARCVIDVNVKPVERVYVSPTAVTLIEGQAYPIVGTALPYDATDLTLSWRSSNEALATVQDGRVLVKDITDAQWKNIINPATGAKWTDKDIAAGKCTTTVTISCSSVSNSKLTAATCVVTIKQGVLATQLSLNKYYASLNLGGSTQVTATILPKDATVKTVTWSSSDPTVASVSSTGKITAHKAGTCVVRAVSNGSGAEDLTAECEVTVSAVISGSIGLSALDVTMYKDQTMTLVATVIPSNTTNKEVTFTSSNPKVAMVDSSTGVITALTNGKATITVTANDGSKATATCLITVKDRVVVSKITLNLKDFALLHGDTTVLTATVEPDYASEMDVTWTSSNPSVVSVDENGKVSGLLAGQSAVITATAKDGSGVTAKVSVDVVSAFYGSGKVVNCLRRVNVRKTPSGQAQFMGYAYLNETYKVLGKTGSWYKISYEGQSCYIWSAYIRLIGDGNAEYTSAGKTTAAATGTGTGTGTGTSTGTPTNCTVTNCVYAVNVRSGPGTTYDKVGIAPLNASYKYLGTYGDWYKLQFNATTEAYIHSNYIFVN